MSTPNQVRFETLTVRSYAGISKSKKADIVYPEHFTIDEEKLKKLDPENGIVLFFPEGTSYIQLEGDQGLGKTSLANAIKELCGEDSSDKGINLDDKDRKVYSQFIGKDGKRYNVSLTRTGIALEEVICDENGEPQLDQKGKEQRRDVRSPKSTLAQILGPVGMSPMELGEKDGKQQVEWIRSLVPYDQDVIKHEVEINAKLTTALKERKEANAKFGILQKSLSINEYYKNQEEWAQYFEKNAKVYDNIENKLKEIQTKYEQYSKGESGLSVLKERKALIQNNINIAKNRIEELERQLQEAKEQLAANEEVMINNDKKIEDGENYLKANEQIKTDFENLSKKSAEATEFKLKKQAFEGMLVEKNEMDHTYEDKNRLDGLVTEYRRLKREVIKTFTPTIEGLEICVPDDEDPREGIFYHQKPLNILAESEMWEVATQLWTKLNIKIIVVENTNSLGSGAVEQFNKFIQQGGMIFGTLMNRQQKALKIKFDTKI